MLWLWFVVRLLLLALVACTEPEPPDIEVLPDAAVVQPDACSREPSGDCCSLLPDEDAARGCVVDKATPGTCGVVVCWSADCELTRVAFCL